VGSRFHETETTQGLLAEPRCSLGYRLSRHLALMNHEDLAY
jgi:hypothetical protein